MQTGIFAYVWGGYFAILGEKNQVIMHPQYKKNDKNEEICYCTIPLITFLLTSPCKNTIHWIIFIYV